MPRIEIIPSGWETSAANARGEGTPTIDVCSDCSDGLVEGETVPCDVINDLAENGIDVGDNAVFGSTDVAHPSYEDKAGYEDYCDCDLCGAGLTSEDD